MTERPFQALINLVTFDQEIHALAEQIAKVEQEIAELSAQEQASQNELASAKEAAKNMHKEVDEHELKMKELDQQEREKKKLLETLSNYKEYQAVKAEIEAIQQKQIGHEQVLLDAWNKLETAQRAAEQMKQKSAEAIKKIHDTTQEKEQKIASLREELAAHKKARPEKEGHVPEEWLEKYVLMRARVPDPVVPIMQNSCSACFAVVTSQDVIRAKRGALIQCKGCYRLLYMPEVMEAAQ